VGPVAGEHHNCHEHPRRQAEPQATADPARGASEPTPSLRSSAQNYTCEALAMKLSAPAHSEAELCALINTTLLANCKR